MRRPAARAAPRRSRAAASLIAPAARRRFRPAACRLREVSRPELAQCLQGKTVLFAGDSLVSPNARRRRRGRRIEPMIRPFYVRGFWGPATFDSGGRGRCATRSCRLRHWRWVTTPPGRRGTGQGRSASGGRSSRLPPPPPNRTRRVLHPVLIGHAASCRLGRAISWISTV